jgi:hypothetical protein
MTKIKIKVGHQEQADKPIYLLPTGAIQCGRFRYEGRCKRRFKAIHERILSLASDNHPDGVVDVSQYHFWDAIRIYHDYVVSKWLKSVSAEQIERFANETEVVMMLKEIQAEFKRAILLRLQRELRRADPEDPNRPRQAWQIL